MSHAQNRWPHPSQTAVRWMAPTAALVAVAAVAGADAAGRSGLAIAVIALQAVLGLTWSWVFSATAEAATLVALAVIAADAVILRERTAGPGSIAGVLGLSAIAVLFHQVARRDERGVVAALTSTLSTIVIASALTLLLPLRQLQHGRSAVLVGIVAAGAAVIVIRLLPGPDVVARIVALAVGAAAGLGCGLPRGGLSAAAALALGAAAALAALLTDRVGMRMVAPVTADGRRRWYPSALAVSTALMPLALASPIAYLAGRIIATGSG